MKIRALRIVGYSFAIASLALSPLPALAATDNGTLSVGAASVDICAPGYASILYGYNGGGFGSYSPTGLTGGNTVAEVIEYTNCPVATFLIVSGFSSSPGSNWLTSITCNGVTKSSGTASFGYFSGSASWQWTDLFGLENHVGSNVSCTIVHN